MKKIIHCIAYLALAGLSVCANTMIGSSGYLALDTRAGDINVESLPQAQIQAVMRLSTRWDGADTGSLTINGVECRTLGSSAECDFPWAIPANAETSYLCKWLVGGKTYTRTIKTTGARKSAMSGAAALDTHSGVRTAPDVESLRYSNVWAGGNSVKILQNGEEIFSGSGEGYFDWNTPGWGVWTLTHQTLNGVGEVIDTLTAQFEPPTQDMTVSVAGYSGTYDGNAHEITVTTTATSEGATIKYASSQYGAYEDNPITRTDAGTQTVWCEVSKPGYHTITNSATITISPRSISDATVTLGGALTYTGSPQTKTVLSVIAGGLDATGSVSLSGNVATDAGSYTMTLTGTGNFTGSTTKSWSIAKKSVVPPSIASKAYTGATLTADVASSTLYHIASNAGGINVGQYDVVLTLKDAANYKWNDSTAAEKTLKFNITKSSNSWLVNPTISGWTYGQAANAPNMGAARFGTAGVTYSATPQNAGNYTATFTVAETANYAGLSKAVNFTIAKATYDMSSAHWNANAFTYDGTQKSVIVEGLPAGVTVKSYANNAKTAAGHYIASVTFNYDATNYNAPALAACDWSIAKKNIAGATITLGDALVYTGVEQTQAVTGVKIDGLDATYTVSGNKATEAGVYTLTVTGTGNFTGSATKQFNVAAKPLTQAMVAAIPAQNYTGFAICPKPAVRDAARGVTLAENTDYTLGWEGNVGPGAAMVIVTGRGNYGGTVLSAFTIKSKEEEKLEEIFDDLPAVIEPDGEGGWKVTITNNLDLSEGPIEIPDNIGEVTIDLGGYDLVGADGEPGGDTAPGGNGTPAIVIVQGDGEGETTHLSVITTGGDDMVKGGDGGAGNPGGNGAPAILDMTDSGVKIDIGAGITVQGGDGGSSVDGNGGAGGAGIDGDVGVNDGTIIGGKGGSSVNGDGGSGGAGVDGDVDINNGDITGGAGGTSENGKGGAGGTGVTGDIGRNDGSVSGGQGGISANGENGADGKSVGGTVGGGTGTTAKIALAVPSVPSAEYTGEPVDPVVPESDLWTVEAPRNLVLPGTYDVKFTLIDSWNYVWAGHSGATVAVDFTILNPPPSIQTEGGGKSGRENAASAIATYDGRGHGISVVVTYPPSGATVAYSRSRTGPFSFARPLWTNVVDGAETWYAVSAEGFDTVTNMATVTIVPKALSAAMVAGKKLVENGKGEISASIALADIPPCEITASDWEYVSWEARASGGGTAKIRGKGNYAGTIAIDVPNEMIVVFDAVYGDEATVRTATTQTPGKPYVLPPTNPQYRGYDFIGWFTKRDGGEEITSSRIATLRDGDVVYAHWRIRSYRTSFELNGGSGACEPFTLDFGTVYPALPEPARAGYLFDGWWTTPGFARGTRISEDDPVPSKDTTLYAKWLRRKLWYDDAVFHIESATTYDGYLIDKSEKCVGSISVKLGKPGNSTGVSKVKASISIAGSSKVNISGTTYDGKFEGSSGGRTLSLVLGESGMSGRFGAYEIDGARNIFAAKDADSKVSAAQALKRWQGTYVLCLKSEAGNNGVSIAVGSKGRTKVKGVLPNGAKVSVNTQLLVGERECAIAVSSMKKGSEISFLVWLCEDGSVECSNIDNPAWTAEIANAKAGAYLGAGAKFRFDASAFARMMPGLLVDLLPDGLAVRMDGIRFAVDKAGKVKLLKDKSGVDETKLGTNPSGLKLSYKIKDCTFKGSFTGYTLSGGKLKKTRFAVSGVVINGVGYGSASIKKPSIACPVLIK